MEQHLVGKPRRILRDLGGDTWSCLVRDGKRWVSVQSGVTKEEAEEFYLSGKTLASMN